MSPRFKWNAKGLLAIFSIIISQWLLFAARANASPVPGSNARLEERYVTTNVSPRDPNQPGPLVSDYPTDTDIIYQFRIGLPGGRVFWTEIHRSMLSRERGSQLAAEFAHQNHFTYIYDAFPGQFM
jgi:hypothetical protein